MTVKPIVFSSGSIVLHDDDLLRANSIAFDTFYDPGGIYGSASFFVPRSKPLSSWAVREGLRCKLVDEFQTVYEGIITNIGPSISGGQRGVNVTCTGYWGQVLGARKWRKWWADDRISEEAWYETDDLYSAGDISPEKMMNVGRTNCIRITPNNVAFTSGQYHRINYTMPTGLLIRRITLSYKFDKQAQNWYANLYNPTSLANEWVVNATGTGTADVTLVTPAQTVILSMVSNANQTPANNATNMIYVEISDLVVYSETGNINLTEIAKDVQGKVTALSADTRLINSNTQSLVPFISEVDSFADILNKAAAAGDSSNNAWVACLDKSDLSTDDKPILRVEQKPALTDAEWYIKLGESNCGDVTFEKSINAGDCANWIGVKYKDANNKDVYLTPDDDTDLKDTASITRNGQVEEWIDVDTTSPVTAKAQGLRVLGEKKSAAWTCANGIPVHGYIRGKGGATYPCTHIRAGQRIRVEDSLDDLSGTGLTWLITNASYDGSGDTMTLSVGRPSGLYWLAGKLAEPRLWPLKG